MDREGILRSLFTKAIEDTIETLPYTIQVFQEPLYDLKKTVINDLDFLLGAFFAQVILFYSVYCSNKDFITNLYSINDNYFLLKVSNKLFIYKRHDF